jgi:hypothetical protein
MTRLRAMRSEIANGTVAPVVDVAAVFMPGWHASRCMTSIS